jgi:hypothetical protein
VQPILRLPVIQEPICPLTLLKLLGVLKTLSAMSIELASTRLRAWNTTSKRPSKARLLHHLVASTGRARLPLFLGRHFLAVTRSAILSYSVFDMMRRVTNSPGSL